MKQAFTAAKNDKELWTWVFFSAFPPLGLAFYLRNNHASLSALEKIVLFLVAFLTYGIVALVFGRITLGS